MPMSTMSYLETEEEHALRPYRSVSKAAVVALALGLVSLGGFLFIVLIPLSVVGLTTGLVALRVLRRYPHEFSGRIPAVLGIVLCSVSLVGGSVMHSVDYATEVPEGYTRITFDDLQPEPEAPDSPISRKAVTLNGAKVFIKGYVYPDGQQTGIKRFVLVRDIGTCCFGGQPKLTHMVEVTLQDPLRVEYAIRLRKLAGVLKVDERLKPVSGVGGVYFQLTADHLK